MLIELSIQRIALIDSLRLQLQSGMNVFTGETGAGKSIVLDAIGLLLGNRASVDMIRAGSDDAVVEALVQVPDSTYEPLRKLLVEDWGIPLDGKELLITREVHRNGRSVCRLNGRMATVQMLRELGVRLVQQHGQHDAQGLLHADEQLRALDLFAGHGPLLRQVRKLYHAYQATRQELEDSRMEEQERVRRLDMLNFQIEEIELGALRAGEDEELREQRKRLQNAEKLTVALERAKAMLEGADRAAGAVSLLSAAAEEVAAASALDSSLDEAVQLLHTAQVHADEAARVVFRYADALEADPAQLETVDSRFAQIRSLQRKYGASVEDVLSYLQAAVEERAKLLNHERQLNDLQARLEQADSDYIDAAGKLHASRSRAAQKLGGEIEQVLKELSMPNARFTIQVNRRSTATGEAVYGEDGTDSVQFLFSANKGEDVKPVQKIASGGELSRTLLAIKAVLAETDDLETLIFDEIDTGVSGQAAQSIAQQMRKVAVTRQVICVTHSAQLAAAADVHYYIEKADDGDVTSTTVQVLDETGRIHELARLLGSAVSDDTAVHHAQALLERGGGRLHS